MNYLPSPVFNDNKCYSQDCYEKVKYVVRWPGWFELNAYCPECTIKASNLLVSQGYNVTILEIPIVEMPYKRLSRLPPL